MQDDSTRTQPWHGPTTRQRARACPMHHGAPGQRRAMIRSQRSRRRSRALHTYALTKGHCTDDRAVNARRLHMQLAEVVQGSDDIERSIYIQYTIGQRVVSRGTFAICECARRSSSGLRSSLRPRRSATQRLAAARRSRIGRAVARSPYL